MTSNLGEGGRGHRGSVKAWDGALSMQATKNPAALSNVSIYAHFDFVQHTDYLLFMHAF